MLSEITNGNGQAPLRVIQAERGATDEAYPPTSMCVKKRNGSSEPVDLNKIVRAVGRCAAGLSYKTQQKRRARRPASGVQERPA